MGIFDVVSKKKNAEEVIMRALAKNELLDFFINQVQYERDGNGEHVKDNEWVSTVQGYYDNRYRMVFVGDDRIVLHSVSYEVLIDKKNKKNEDRRSVGLNYTEMGYMPIPEYRNEKGNVVLDKENVLRLWAELVKERMQAIFPNAEFDEFISTYYIDGNFQGVYFHYRLPELHWKGWF